MSVYSHQILFFCSRTSANERDCSLLLILSSHSNLMMMVVLVYHIYYHHHPHEMLRMHAVYM